MHINNLPQKSRPSRQPLPHPQPPQQGNVRQHNPHMHRPRKPDQRLHQSSAQETAAHTHLRESITLCSSVPSGVKRFGLFSATPPLHGAAHQALDGAHCLSSLGFSPRGAFLRHSPLPPHNRPTNHPSQHQHRRREPDQSPLQLIRQLQHRRRVRPGRRVACHREDHRHHSHHHCGKRRPEFRAFFIPAQFDQNIPQRPPQIQHHRRADRQCSQRTQRKHRRSIHNQPPISDISVRTERSAQKNLPRPRSRLAHLAHLRPHPQKLPHGPSRQPLHLVMQLGHRFEKSRHRLQPLPRVIRSRLLRIQFRQTPPQHFPCRINLPPLPLLNHQPEHLPHIFHRLIMFPPVPQHMHRPHNPPPLQLPDRGRHIRPRHAQRLRNLLRRQRPRRQIQQRVNLRHRPVNPPPRPHLSPVEDVLLLQSSQFRHVVSFSTN